MLTIVKLTMPRMINKYRYAIALIFLLGAGCARSGGLGPHVYSVREAAAKLSNDQGAFGDQTITIKAYVVDRTQGLGCDDFLMLTDQDQVEAYHGIYHLSPTDAKAALQNIPILEAMAIPHTNTVYGIYRGHFHDSKLMAECGDAGKRLVLEERLKEIQPETPGTEKVVVIDNGFLIVDGKYVQRPYRLELKNYRIKVNNILIWPYTEDQAAVVTMNSDKVGQIQFDQISMSLRGGYLILHHSSERGGSALLGMSKADMNAISEVVTGPYSREEKISRVSQIAKFANPAEVEQVVDHWAEGPPLR